MPPKTALKLDHSSPLPLHVQAEELLRRMIERPEYRNGKFLPDEVSLASRLGISRSTLRAAIGRLVMQGRLRRKAGLGTRVCEPNVHSGVGAWHSFTREMEAKGIRVETYATETVFMRASAEIAAALQVPENTRILLLHRVRGWDGQPEVDFKSYFHPRVKFARNESFDRPLYEIIKDSTSLVADQSIEKLAAVRAGKKLSALLRVEPDTPLLRRDRVVLDTGRRPLEFAVVHYRCERFHLTLNLHHK